MTQRSDASVYPLCPVFNLTFRYLQYQFIKLRQCFKNKVSKEKITNAELPHLHARALQSCPAYEHPTKAQLLFTTRTSQVLHEGGQYIRYT